MRSMKARGMESMAMSEISNPKVRAFTETDTFGESVGMNGNGFGFKSSRQASEEVRPERVHSVPLPQDAIPHMVTEPLPDSLPRPEAVRSGNLSVGSPSEMSPTAKQAVPHTCWLQKSRSFTTRRRSISKGEAFALSKTQASLSVPHSVLGVLNPMGHFRNFWDFIGIFLLAMDTIFLPVQFVAEDFYEMFPILKVKSQIAVFYWFIDILISFFTGYLDKGTLVDDHRAIARRYIKSWFVPDLVVTAIDLVLMFTGEESSTAQSAGTRVLRLLRLCRVVRLGKLTRAAAFLRDRFESDVAYTQFTLIIAMLSMMLLEHVIACGWFGLGSLSSESHTWITSSSKEGQSFTLLYTTSLRWALSQLGIGGTNIEAVNVREGIYTAVVALVSLLTFSTVISFMTSLIGTLQHKRMEETQQFGLLRRFLRSNRIPEDLRQRVTRFLQHAYSERGANSEEPYILELLSESLHAELQIARYQDCFTSMPFFAKLFRNNFLSLQEEQVMQTIANKAMTIVETADDDVIFCHGNMATATYFALDESCNMLYLRLTCSALKPKGREWITEMCLWTEWLHLGDLITSSFSKFIAIKSQEFCAIVSKSGPCQVQAHHYALEYVEAMNDAEDVSDIWQRPVKEMSPPPPISDMENIFGWSSAMSRVLPSP